ncbi:unnamed protein product [Rhizophagus irregularis]|nr:unnamed protein product [Rhizophagus irregularis]
MGLLKIHSQVDLHQNIIRFFGITDKENEINRSKKYLLVMDIKLSCAISCLHNKEIIHRDLHSNNILIHQNTVKLADFGLSNDESKTNSILFALVERRTPEDYIKLYTDCMLEYRTR